MFTYYATYGRGDRCRCLRCITVCIYCRPWRARLAHNERFLPPRTLCLPPICSFPSILWSLWLLPVLPLKLLYFCGWSMELEVRVFAQRSIITHILGLWNHTTWRRKIFKCCIWHTMSKIVFVWISEITHIFGLWNQT